MELQEEASVAKLKEVVGSQQGVRPELLRVLFAGRELRSDATLQVRSGQSLSCPRLLFMLIIIISSSSQGCDLPEQSTVHVVLPPSGPSSSSQSVLLQERLARREEEEQDSLTRLNLSSSRLLSTSTGLAVILAEGDGGGNEEAREEAREEAQAHSE